MRDGDALGRARQMAAMAGAALLAVALAGCQSDGGDAPDGGRGASDPATILLATNMQGKVCQYETEARPEFNAVQYQGYAIFCEDYERPSAELVALPVASGGTVPTEVEAWAETGLWRQLLDQRMTCDRGRSLDLAPGAPAYLMQCKLKKGGWPYVAMAARKGGRIFLTEGLPTSLPAIRLGVLQLYDPQAQQEAAKAAESGDGELARLEALLEGINTFGATDLAAYNALSRLGALYNSVGNYAGAEEAYRKALEVHEKVLGVGNLESAEVLMNLALEVSNQERFEEADGLLSRAETLARASTDASDTARYLLYQAFHHANQRDYEQAMRFARQSCTLRATLFEDQQKKSASDIDNRSSVIAGVSSNVIRSSSADIIEIAQCRYLEANMLLRIGALVDAEAAIREAQRILGDSRRAPEWWTAQVLITYGQIAASLGRVDEGVRLVQNGIDIRAKLFGKTRLTALGYQALGEIHLVFGSLDDSLAAFREMADILRADEIQSRGLTFEKLSPYLTALLQAGTDRPNDRAALFGEMFEASQMTQEGVTGQTIARTTARLASGDDGVGRLMRRVQEATAERDELQYRLGQAQAQINTTEQDPELNARIEDLQEKSRGAAAKVKQLEQELQEAFPNYAQLVATKTIGVEQIGAQLRRDEALVSFAIGDRDSFVFLVRQDGVYPARLDVTRDSLALDVARLRRPFERAAAGTLEVFDMQLSYEMYRKLLGPVEEQLSGVRHLVVQPAGALLSLPFAMLVTAEPPSAREDYVDAAWLVNKTASSVVPSISSFIELRKIAGKNQAPKPFIGFGNPTFTGNAGAGLGALAAHCDQGDPIPPALLRSLAPLPETAEELASIAQSLGAGPDSVFLAASATEERVLDVKLSDYRVVFFATHGLLPGELNCQSEPALALSPPPAPVDDTSRDGLLDASEIARLDMNADLVVLSACNTGGGGTGKLGGEALSGLARSFFFAGARTLMVSHWVVPSRSAVLLTTEMFRILATRPTLDFAEALRQSQIKLTVQTEFSHPIFWAPFTIVGDGGSVAPLTPPALAPVGPGVAAPAPIPAANISPGANILQDTADAPRSVPGPDPVPVRDAAVRHPSRHMAAAQRL